MTSFIIVSQQKKTGEEYIQKICKDFGIDALDITVLEHQKQSRIQDGTRPSIGIEDIRKFHEKLFLTPFKSPNKAMVIKQAELLTTEAQNALLKVLEEPPKNTIVILTTTDKYHLLPTILSRCSIFEDNQLKGENNNAISNEGLETLFQKGIGERLKLAQDLGKNKDEALNFLTSATLLLHQQLIKNPEKQKSAAEKIKQFQKTYTVVKTTNTNLRLALENLFLSFSEQKR